MLPAQGTEHLLALHPIDLVVCVSEYVGRRDTVAQAVLKPADDLEQGFERQYAQLVIGE